MFSTCLSPHLASSWRARHLPPRRYRPAVFTAAAVAGTLALGWAPPWPAAPGLALLAARAGLPLAGALAAILASGLIAHQIARSTFPRADPVDGAVAAALAAATLLPGMGLAALLIPAILVLFRLRGPGANRVVAAMVHCGAAASVGAIFVNQIGLPILGTIILSIPMFNLYRGPRRAANDNPSMKRIGESLTGCWTPKPMLEHGFVRFSGSGEYGNVQQQQSRQSRREADGTPRPAAPGKR